MRDNLKQFIEKYISLIENNNYILLYQRAKEDIPYQIGNLTFTLIEAGINPLDYLNNVISEMFSNSMIKNLDIPEGIKTIDSQAFLDCFELKEITLPSTLTGIHSTAFKGCYHLLRLSFKGTTAEFLNINIPNTTFLDCEELIIECTDGKLYVNRDGTITS